MFGAYPSYLAPLVSHRVVHVWGSRSAVSTAIWPRTVSGAADRCVHSLISPAFQAQQSCGRVADPVAEVAARVGSGPALALLGGVDAVRGRGLSLDGWGRTCWCGIWLIVAQWGLQSGRCAGGHRLATNVNYSRSCPTHDERRPRLLQSATLEEGKARDGTSQSLDAPLVPRVPRPMLDGYG